QNSRDDRGVAARNHTQQEGGSRALPEFRLSRPRVVGHRNGGPYLFREIGQGSFGRSSGGAGRSLEGTELLQSGPASGASQRAPRLCLGTHAGRWWHYSRAEG